MDIYMAILEGIGMAVIFAVAAGFLLHGLAALIAKFDERRERIYRQQYDKALVEIGQRLQSASWWFSEDHGVQIAVSVLSDRLMRGRGTDAADWREEWRNKMREEKTTGTVMGAATPAAEYRVSP